MSVDLRITDTLILERGCEKRFLSVDQRQGRKVKIQSVNELRVESKSKMKKMFL